MPRHRAFFATATAGCPVPVVDVDPLLCPFDAPLIGLPSIDPIAEIRKHEALAANMFDDYTSLEKTLLRENDRRCLDLLAFVFREPLQAFDDNLQF